MGDKETAYMEETDTMTLKIATHVEWSNVLEISTEMKQFGSSYLIFKCGKCGTALGKIYKSTPVGLDHLRDAFTFDLAALYSYNLGSTDSAFSVASIPAEKMRKSNPDTEKLDAKITSTIQNQNVLEDRLTKLERWRDDTEHKVSNSQTPAKRVRVSHMHPLCK